MGRAMQFHRGDRLNVDGASYTVTGGMEFHNKSDGSRWAEYCLQEEGARGTRWLSVDNMYEEYAIYTQCSYSQEFDSADIFRNGWKQADQGNACVTSCFGSVDAEPGDTVRYTEYEDGAEEHILSVEQWEDETEYSKGYYLDSEEISLLSQGSYGPPEGNGTASNRKTFSAGKYVILLILAAAVMSVIGIAASSFMQSRKKDISKFLESSPLFAYQTSITSDLNNKEKADVYTTSLTVDLAVKEIIQSIDGDTEDVQKNGEDDSVAILTKKEYCLVYTSTEGNTSIQISSRAYVYQSTNTPYHATGRTHSYYRSFYYTMGFLNDRNRYKSAVSGFENFSGDTVDLSSDDPYRSYSDSVRQSSVNSRRSSGGGVSSGK